MADALSAEMAISIVKYYGAVSGVELNFEKCNFTWLGGKRFDTNPICGRAPTYTIEVISVTFSIKGDYEQDNLDPVKARIKQALDQ